MSTTSLQTRVAAPSSPGERPHGPTCRRCNRPRKIRARELCGSCYNSALRNNQLGDFPAKPPRRTTRVPIPDSAGGRPHGRAKYVHELCGCDICVTASRDYNRRLKQQNAYGRSNMVDAEPARRHVLMLQGEGLGTRRIADLANVDRKAVQILMNGRSDRGTPPPKKIRRETAEKILAVEITLDAFAGKANMDSTGGRRRLQALIAIGWSQVQLSKHIGVSDGNFTTLLDRPRWTAATVRAVHALYDELWNQQPPTDTAFQRRTVTAARKRARENGWPPPMAWDDDTIDDPAAEPEGVDGVSHAPRLGLPPADELLWLTETESTTEIARRFGVKEHSVRDALRRAREKAA